MSVYSNATREQLEAWLTTAREAIDAAAHAGIVSRNEADELLTQISPVPPARTLVTVQVALEGDQTNLINDRYYNVAGQVEHVLAGLARQIGAEIVTGSTAVSAALAA